MGGGVDLFLVGFLLRLAGWDEAVLDDVVAVSVCCLGVLSCRLRVLLGGSMFIKLHIPQDEYCVLHRVLFAGRCPFELQDACTALFDLLHTSFGGR